MRTWLESRQNKLISNRAEFSWPLCPFLPSEKKKKQQQISDGRLMRHGSMEKSGRRKAVAQGQRAHWVECGEEKHRKDETRGKAETWHAGGGSWWMIESWTKMKRWMERFWLCFEKKKQDLVFTHRQLAASVYLRQRRSKIPFSVRAWWTLMFKFSVKS